MSLLLSLHMKPVNTVNMCYRDQVSYWLPDLQVQKVFILCWHWFSEWSGELVTFSFAYKGDLCLISGSLQRIAIRIIQDSWPKTVDTPLTLMLRMGQGVSALVFDHEGGIFIIIRQWLTMVNMVQLTVWYLNITIKRKTRHQELEIGTPMCRCTRYNFQVDYYRSRFGLLEWSWPSFWLGLGPNTTIFVVWTLNGVRFPRPIANTSYNTNCWWHTFSASPCGKRQLWDLMLYSNVSRKLLSSGALLQCQCVVVISKSLVFV